MTRAQAKGGALGGTIVDMLKSALPGKKMRNRAEARPRRRRRHRSIG
ncbi:MAG: hypothetical protein QM770_02380 [Tepidisphaeraceae bacterium]